MKKLLTKVFTILLFFSLIIGFVAIKTGYFQITNPFESKTAFNISQNSETEELEITDSVILFIDSIADLKNLLNEKISRHIASTKVMLVKPAYFQINGTYAQKDSFLRSISLAKSKNDAYNISQKKINELKKEINNIQSDKRYWHLARTISIKKVNRESVPKTEHHFYSTKSLNPFNSKEIERIKNNVNINGKSDLKRRIDSLHFIVDSIDDVNRRLMLFSFKSDSANKAKYLFEKNSKLIDSLVNQINKMND